ncbi:hypothetical protein ACFE04_002269 [Oxalis oulophora]
MDNEIKISIDKLPVKRLESIEENGAERFPLEMGYDEKRESLIRKIDFAFAVQKDDDKKAKKDTTSTAPLSLPQNQWQGMAEHLRSAQQELSIILDLINTVEANDAVTVAGMTRPKLLPHEVLSDLGVSAATKLQCYKHIGNYFKQSAKALEQQIAKEDRFYGALIRLQQNWKVKRQRVAAPSSGNEGFTFDLFDNSLFDLGIFRSALLSTIRVEHDSTGMLAINLPQKSRRSIRFGFVGIHPSDTPKESSKIKTYGLGERSSRQTEKEQPDSDESVKETHLLLCEVHQAMFDELVFDIVNREAFNKSYGVNVTGMHENYLQLSIGQGTSVFISLVPSVSATQKVDEEESLEIEPAVLSLDFYDGVKSEEELPKTLEKKGIFPNHVCYEIYLQQIFHEMMREKAKHKHTSTGPQILNQAAAKDGTGLLGHFCLSLAHRIFANKVLMELENVVSGVPYLQLISHPTWQSRTSSWTLFMEVPQSVRHNQSSEVNGMKNNIKSKFRTRVVVNDNCITVEAEGAPNIVGLFKGNSDVDTCTMNKYDCNLADLPVIVLQQVASQVICWLQEEALVVGVKAECDFLSLSLELEQGERLSVVAHVDPEDIQGCISWWFVMQDCYGEEEENLDAESRDNSSTFRKPLGYLSLETLYSTLMDLVSLCSGGKHKFFA